MENKISHHSDEFIAALVREREHKKSFKEIYPSIIKHALLILVGISMLAPFFWMVSSSLKTSANIFVIPPQWLPNPARWQNFVDVFNQVPFFHWILNTVFYTVCVAFFEVTVSVMVAYGFARFRFRFKKTLFMALLLTIMIPGEISIVPGYIFWVKLGQIFGTSFINTYVPLILPAIGGQAVFIFFMTQYFRTIPKDFSEAAYINGANSWKILWRIYFPMSLPAILTIAISSIMGVWNAFLAPLIYINDSNKFPIQVGLSMFQGTFSTNWSLLMAATTISVLPMILLFFSLQKYFIPSNKQDGVK